MLGIIESAPRPHAQQQQQPPPPSHPPPPSPPVFESPETPQHQHAARPAPWTEPARNADKFADKFAEKGDGAARRVPNGSRRRRKWTPEEARAD